MNYSDNILIERDSIDECCQSDKMEVGIAYYIFYAIFTVFVFYEPFFDILGNMTKVYTSVWCLFLLLSSGKCITVRGFHLLIFGWLSYYCVSVLWTPNIEQAKLYVFTIGLMSILFICSTLRQYDTRYIESILLIMQYMSVSLAIVSLFSIQSSGAGARETVSILGKSIDPNNQVALISYGSGLCLLDILLRKKYRRFFALLGFAICSLSIFRCGSRSGIVLLAIQFLIAFYAIIKANDEFNKKLCMMMLILLVVLICIVVLINFVPEKIIERLFGLGELKFTDGTNREAKWAEGWARFLEDPIFGNGWGAFECHNTFLTILVDVGLFGALPLGMLFIDIVVKSLKKENAYALMVFIPEMVASFFIGAQNKRFFWVAIIISSIMVYCEKSDRLNG